MGEFLAGRKPVIGGGAALPKEGKLPARKVFILLGNGFRQGGVVFQHFPPVGAQPI